MNLPTLVSLLSSLTIPLILSILFSVLLSVSRHRNLFVSTCDFLIVAKPNRAALFFMFTFMITIITIFFGSYKPSSGDIEWFFSQPPLVYEMNSTSQENEGYDSSGDDEVDEKYHGFDGYDEDNDTEDIGDIEWFFPQPPLVYEMKSTSQEDEISYDSSSDDEGDEKCHGSDGYDEDNDDDIDTEDVDSDEDENGNDFKRRIEEFIAKVNQKWREELLSDRLLCIEDG